VPVEQFGDVRAEVLDEHRRHVPGVRRVRVHPPHQAHGFVDCFFPSAHLDELIGLEETLQRKLAYADAAIGVGDVLPGAAGKFEVNLRDTREQIQDLLQEKATMFEDCGTPSAALSGEEYRKRLATALDNPYTRKAVTSLPWMAVSGLRNPSAARSGYVFCMRMGGDPDPDAPPQRKPWFRFVPVDPATWRPLPAPPPMAGSSWTTTDPDDDGPEAPAGHIVEDDTLTSLMTADPGDDTTPRDLPDHVYDAAYAAWAIARDHALADWTELTDPNKFKPEPPKAMREAAMLVYTAGGLALSTQDQRELLSRLNTAPPPRVVADIRRVVRDDTLTDAEKITALRRIADDAGLAPAPAPDTLPPITADDIHLIAWMAVRGRDAEQ
jgi:hypothetical protein